MTDAPRPHPLVTEAVRKAAIAWVAVAHHPPVGVWCLPLDGALYVVTGPGEQAVPGLAGATAAAVTLRGDHGGRIVTWPAVVSRVDPADPQWPQLAGQLAGKRLNARGPLDALVARWAAECAVLRLTPADTPPQTDDDLPADAQAAPPRQSTAARPTRRPFRLHRVRRR